MLNGLNTYIESVHQLINFLVHFCQMFFSKEDKILIKNLRQLKGYNCYPFS